MKISGAIFDMDGTLIDSLMFWDMFWARLGDMYFSDSSFRPDAVTEKAIRTLPLKDGMILLHKNCNIGKSGEELLDIANKLCTDFYRDDVELKDGVIEFLDYCHTRGIRMCIASATAPDLLKIAMDKFDLDKYFLKIFSCSEIGKGKEHPDVFIKAHEFLDTPKESTWIFEDSIVALETATKAGYKTVGIYDQYNFNLDRVAAISTEYIDRNQSLKRLIPEIE